MRRKLLWTLLLTVAVSWVGALVTSLTNTRPELGLDLQGGLSITQQPVGDFSQESLDLAVERIRERVDGLGISEPEILRQGDAIVVNLPGVDNVQEARELVQVTGKVSLRPALSPCTTSAPEPPPDSTTTSTATTTAGSATSEPVPSSAPSTTAAGGPSRQPQSAPSTTAPATTSPATTTAGQPAPTTAQEATTTTIPVVPTEPISLTIPTSSVPIEDQQLPDVAPEAEGLFKARGGNVCQLGPEGGTGEVFDNDATARILQGSAAAGWGVTVSLRDGQGNATWNALANQCFQAGQTCPTGQLAIVLDDEVQSAPTVETNNFNGEVQITGQFSEEEAKDLARVINSGSLPVDLRIESEQTVSPTLGKDSMRAAWIAGLVGVALVLLFVAFYYRTLGLIAAAGLTVSAGLLWTVVSILSETRGLTLSLSGMAGIIVSVGVTVDSYVVFFERLKDEVRSGRTLKNSASRAFAGAWRTIVVADLVSFIGAITLWALTVGSVRNFAFFLGLSTLTDLVVSYFFTRPAALLLARTPWMARRKVMGIEAATTGGVR
jgi:preprotein translocase subunit SecD